MTKIKKDTLYFSKTKEDASIPVKRDEDAGFDLYSCFDVKEIVIKPNEIKLIPTGIAVAFAKDFVLVVKERSSTGKIGMSVRMGIIDSGYRGEIYIGINNTSTKTITISKEPKENTDHIIYYPYNKAIAQAILLPLPQIKTVTVPYEELKNFESIRNDSMSGASGK